MSRRLVAGLIVFALLSGLAGVLPVVGLAESGPVIAINQVLTDQFPQVSVYVSVVDAVGVPVSGLTEQSFMLQEDGRPVEGYEVSTASGEGMHIILAMDASGSMLGGQALPDAKAAVKTFLSQLTDRDRVALVIFSESADFASDFTADHDALQGTVDALTVTPLARTALYEAAFEAAERMGQLPPGRKAVVIFTDGTDTVGGFTLKDATDKASEANVPFYTIGLVGGEFDASPMRQLAEATGGSYLEAPASDQLTAQFERVRQLLDQQYTIRYTSTLQPEDRVHELVVEASVSDTSLSDRRAFVPLPVTPWVQFRAPLEGEEISGSIPVSLDVVAKEPIAEVVLAVDGTELARLTERPYRYDWDLAGLAAGTHSLIADASDVAGNVGSAHVSVNVKPALAAQIQSPADGSVVSGIVDIQPRIEASRPVSLVTLLIDGTPVGTVDAPPYIFSWDTGATQPGPHEVAVQVQDERGETAQAQIGVDVQPALSVSLASPAEGETVAGSVELRPDIQASNAINRVTVLVDGAEVATLPAPPYTYAWDTSALESGPHQLTVQVEDEHGLQARADVQVEVKPVLAVSWISPEPDAEVSDIVTLAAQAEGHYGVDRVEFYSNGTLLGSAKEAPYELKWPTTSLAAGSYALSACAYDVMGHKACTDLGVALGRSGLGAGMFLAFALLAVVVVGVMLLVMRSRRKIVPARVPVSAQPQPAGRGRSPGPVAGPSVSPMDRGRAQPSEPGHLEPMMGDPALAPAMHGEAMPMGWLIVQSEGGTTSEEYALQAGEMTLGRASENDIQVLDELASRRHAVVYYDDRSGRFVYRDLNPTNPSIINGEDYRGPHFLRSGDTILIGETYLTYHQA